MNIIAFILWLLAAFCFFINAWGYETRVRLVSLGLGLFTVGAMLQLILVSHGIIAH